MLQALCSIGGDSSCNVSRLVSCSTTDRLTISDSGHVLPGADNSYDLGSSSLRWRNIYTTDLHLNNDRGDWTIIEEEEYLSIRNNKNGKMYKFVLEEIE